MTFLDNLKNNQRQLDMDGCEVGVSRQALEELIAFATSGEPVAWQSRARTSMEGDYGDWSEWRDGRAPQPVPFYYEVEERPLYTLTTPDGFKLVPIKLTAEMKARVLQNGGPQAVAYAIAAWPDLLDAAP